mmetsp:Transcript_20832/g.30879  ORF Transcript_20832/g.30879 Transcript_20832/m.30879 type:complete len:433 (-) Transcript_20832:141-1439(-)|eukprot:CAMPEP_0171461610 /NCGR_PEP_ID=MMETSP0945-20130129/5986_1 /TAXON_ID=109269 /ORGANISM="Vaucheria litorea, Strain CCMP2940" /LENGTH=432 /DNA_ID=CAMNT_0011987985 /DNA_START=109 /DNA_END=1407 /DNA_ORIENTATION=-
MDSQPETHEQSNSETSRSEIFQEILAQGPTEQPDPEAIYRARLFLESSVTVNSNLKKSNETADNLSGDQSCENRPKEDQNMANGLVNWALSPVWMGLDALKWASQTVNDQAVAPAIRYASPIGWAAYFFNIIKDLTPQRARDLVRIFGNATVSFVDLLQIPDGEKFRNAFLKVIDTFITTLSSYKGRQLVIDGTATVVKIAEALDTPETKAAVQQGAVVMARFFDVLASEETKNFLQASADASCKLFELANSPEATVMIAEFTANVVHALEVEHEQHLSEQEEKNGLKGAEEDAEVLVKDYEETIVKSFSAASEEKLLSPISEKNFETKEKDFFPEKENHSRKKLPRHSRDHLSKILKKPTKPLSQQMNPPTAVSVEEILRSEVVPRMPENNIGTTLTADQPKDSLLLAAAVLIGVFLWTALGIYGCLQYFD